MIYPNINTQKTGENIKTLMKNNNITVSNIKTNLGINDKSNIYKWLRGDTLPTIDNLLALSILLKVTINDILITTN